MKSLYLFIASLLLFICTSSMSLTANRDTLQKKFSSELYQALLPAVAAYRVFDFFNQTLGRSQGPICQVCTMYMATLLKYVDIRNSTVDQFLMKDMCPKVPVAYRSLCDQVVQTYGPTIINTLVKTSSPDAACTAIKVCDYPECRLYPKGQEPKMSFSSSWMDYFQEEAPEFEAPTVEALDRIYTKILLDTISTSEDSALAKWVESIEGLGESPIDWLKNLINRLANNHTAIVDLDNDYFSQTSAELRGFNWRGRDCDDTNKEIYPGRKTNPHPDQHEDYNCNGIQGVDPDTNQDYEDMLCANSGQIGIVVMGDSAGAHCEIPVQWVNATMWLNYTWDDIIQALADEVDLPHMSAYTGYAATGYHGSVNSVYKSMYERNKCNFRDYQNLAVNGLRSGATPDTLIRLSRSQTDDQPVIAFLELIGNDVCSSHNDSNSWTTVEEFRTNLIKILDTLDSILPPGSHLVSLGLANGSMIFQAVDNRTHPSGFTYNQYYDYQNCIAASMCWGWLNTNATIRDLTSQRAAELSAVYSEVFANYTAKNFDMIYYDFPTMEIMTAWVASGHDPFLLIEPVDGFHPSQIFNSMLGDYLWAALSTDRPQWLGPVNPNNDKITQLFGDQGGTLGMQ